jgi:uncharacterized protein
MLHGKHEYNKALREMSKKTPKLERVFLLLEESSKDGNPSATYALGTWYLYGRFVRKNINKAVKLFRQAAKDKEPNAIYDLAVCYEKGVGLKLNLKLAMENYMRAVLYGDKQSIYEVGRCYYYGIGINKDRRLAWIWLDRAKELGINENPEEETIINTMANRIIGPVDHL